ncbi:MAG: endo-1,4-beta-xylanase [Phycisphaerales bacterium]|nr:MAG: endo-1,4-beta-xylanase [Phycisphaerales bacterium]
MLRFAVYDDDGPAKDWPLKDAYLIGPEDQAVPGKVRFRDGLIVCKKASAHPAGLCLQHDAGKMGRLMLQTSLLPDRDQPYLLSVELARHRIKMFIAKSEEWQMFDLASDHSAMRRWEESRRMFTRALITEDPLKADQLARRALRYAIDATERLALAHAEVLLHRRFGQRAAPSATLGVRVWPGSDTEPVRELVQRKFDLIAVPLVWRELEIEEGRYNWEPVDRWMEWAAKQGKPVVAGPLLDFSKSSLPKWMYVWQHDYDTCRDLAYEYVERVVHRYRSLVSLWNLASGLNTNDNFSFTMEQMFDLVRMAGLVVRQARKNARTMIELKHPFGEHCSRRPDSVPPVTFLERLIHEGIRLNAVGVQLLFGVNEQGRNTRDIMQISSVLDRYFLLDIPVLVSAMGVPSEPIDEAAGSWRGPWTAKSQSRWVSRMFSVVMSKPFVESVFWAELADHPGEEIPTSALLTDAAKPRPALSKLVNMRKRLRKPLGPMKEHRLNALRESS